jgi:predicted ribosome quality control (RQC) complex YloA/Tae2 family protein
MLLCETGPAENGAGREAGKDHGAQIRALAAACRGAQKKERRKLAKQQAERDDAARWPWYRRIADSIVAQPDRYPRGTHECRVADVHTGKDESVKLNAKLGPHQNARLWYRKAKKGERGHDVACEKVARTEERLRGLAAAIEELRSLDPAAEDVEEKLSEFQGRAEELGVVSRRGPTGGRKAKPTARLPYRRFVVDGYEVYVGKTDAQNDELTVKFAKPWDIWMHISAHAGSHVVVKRRRNSDWPPRQVLAKVGALTVWFSKARHTSYAEVHATEARFVRKRRGAPPGEVIAERGKTLRVSPMSPKELFGEEQARAGESRG